MSFIVTFLGKGGTGRTTIAIAAAKSLAQQGRKVLLLTQDSSPAYKIILGIEITAQPQEIAANLSVAQLSTTMLLEQNWEQVKQLEQQYLRSPILKNVYGQELGILPGMDSALVLNKIREYDLSNQYDVIVYDGSGDLSTLRMFGIPEVLSWYIRRFKGVFQESDIFKALSPFIQPVTAAILNVSWSSDNFANNETNQASQMIEKGRQALADNRVIAYLVTRDNPLAIAQSKYLWGSAQQIGLGVGGVLLNQDSVRDEIIAEFNPLTVTSLPKMSNGEWQTLGDALPNLIGSIASPKPTTFDMVAQKIRVFLPGFDKKQVKLTQNGSEITIEAGDQRRNIDLPPPWSGRSVTGAKFTNNYLELSIG
jgi:anion-transporting  ArsA/GET3 family ATPase